MYHLVFKLYWMKCYPAVDQKVSDNGNFIVF